MVTTRAVWIGSLLTIPAPLPAVAQVLASEPASITQTIDGTKITIEYSRPRARGRKALFGGQVPWDEVWTPGANKSTTLETNRNITLDGHPIPKGKYSVWMQVRKNGQWTAMLDTNTRRYHTDPPDSTAKPIRFEVRPVTAPYAETLGWAFENIRLSGAQLVMRWGKTLVAMDLAVEPTFHLGMPEEKAAPYLGWYDEVKKSPPDSSGEGGPSAFQLEYRNGSLMGKQTVAYMEKGEQKQFSFEFALIPIAEDTFTMGIFLEGEMAELNRELVYEFKRIGGRVASVESRFNDKLLGGYTRRP